MSDTDSILDGKVALVTGANKQGGIGAAIAYTLARSNAQVMITGRNHEELSQTASGFRKKGLTVEAVAGDLLIEDNIKSIIQATIERFGQLDILVNNASEVGLAGDTDILTMEVDLWDRIFETNVRGMMLMTKHVLPHMIKAGSGSIINISSACGAMGHTQYTAYACSKAAINTLTKYTATQCGVYGIRCNAVMPSLIVTNKSSMMPEAVLEAYSRDCLLGRLGLPVDVAKVARFLASNESGYITGQEIIVDGGFGSHIPTTISDLEKSF